MTSIYLNLEKSSLKETEKEANKASIEEDPNNEDSKNKLLYSEASIDQEELVFEEGEIQVCGNLVWRRKDLGFISIHIRPDQEVVISIIEAYTKQLNKVKTMLEATK